MANEERELYKFVNDPKYREKVIRKVHMEQDKAYEIKIKYAQNEKNKLLKARTAEITRVEKMRWTDYAGGKLSVNKVEGIITINGSRYPFSSIQGAEINIIPGCRIETTEQGKSKSKKHVSLGGAVVGGALLGAPGALAGGIGFGKTTTKTKGCAISNQIPTCLHLGVYVNVNGFSKEIVLISSEVDQTSIRYERALNDAQNIISRLQILSKTPVPTSFLKVSEVGSVKSFDKQIKDAEKKLSNAIDAHPTYDIPHMYRTEEQCNMSDDEYLQFLKSMDEQRAAEQAANREAEKEKKAADKAAAKEEKERKKKAAKEEDIQRKAEYRAEREKKKEEAYKEKENKNISGDEAYSHADYIDKFKSAGRIIFNIVFWLISVFYILTAIVCFIGGGILSGIIFLVTALLINPKLNSLLKSKGINIPRWAVIIITIVGFFAGIFAVPTT